MVIVKPVAVWTRQAKDAMEAIRTANGGQDPANLRAAAAIDFTAFASLIEALVALEPHTGRPVGQDMISLARLRPVDEVIL